MTRTGVEARLVGLADIEAAAERIAPVCLRTPLLPLRTPVAASTLWVKPESLQPTGAFKLRGATNAVLALPPDVRARGVVTHSSGNHGQALAHAAHSAGIGCTVVMPHGAAPVKVEATRRWGARVVFVPVAERVSACDEIAARTGATVIPPFDSVDVIAGQGTAGLEIVADLPEVETLLAPVGGGGLISGVAAAVKARSPDTRVVGVEPALAGDLAEGFAAGRHVTWSSEHTGRTSADGLRGTAVGALNWDHIQALVDDVVTVTEDEIAAAMRALALGCRVVAEPSGAVATAAYLGHRDAGPWGRTVAIVSGGNVDPAALATALMSTG
jgi:threonine dehydratase